MAQRAQREVEQPAAGRCLNCGEELHGAFCAACGQRSVPADPTVSELAGDAWHELSGYDGRIAATFRALLRPGALTLDYLQGRRARYLPPVRLYLAVSVIYFVVAAAAPEVSRRSAGDVSGPGGLRIELTDPSGQGRPILTEEDRAEVLNELDQAHWLLRPILKSVAEDPVGFRARVLTIMPRVFFGMLPAFAAILALFYRGRRFPTALVFAAHIHAFAFLLFTFSELAKFSGSEIVAAVVGAIAAVVFIAYALKSLRVVFGGGWPKTIAKAAAIGIAYLIVSMPMFFIIVIWASMV